MTNTLETFRAGHDLEKLACRIAPYFERSGLYVFLLSLVCVDYAANALAIFDHLDLGWHLAAGDLMRARGEVPFQDPWSFSLGDRQWYNLSWLWDVIASAIFQYSGYFGLLVFIVACGAIIAGLLVSLCLSLGASAAAVSVAVFASCLLYPSFPTKPNSYLAASPNIATMLFCVVFYKECLNRTRCFLLPPIMLLWANLHGGFPLGFLILGIFCATALAGRRWRDVKTYSFAGAACFIAIFVNPLGWRIYEGVTATMGHFVQAHITEWQPYAANIVWPGSIPGLIYIIVFVVLGFCFRNPRTAPLEARALSWLFLMLGLHQFRYIAFFFIFSSVPMALYIDRMLPDRLKARFNIAPFLTAGIGGVSLLLLVFVQVRPSLGPSDILSRDDIAYVQDHLAHKRVLNHWNTGGNLIFGTRGTVPVFVDGRAATAYPDALLRDYFALVHVEIDEAVWDKILDKYGIDAVIWPRPHEELRHFLVDRRGWREDYAGRHESVYVRP